MNGKQTMSKHDWTHDRRSFLKSAGMISAGFTGLSQFLDGTQSRAQEYQSEISHYGKLVADPRRIMDLPPGFSYQVLSVTGDVMSDGLRTPGAPDGMAAFDGGDGRVILVRNHELTDDQTTDEATAGLDRVLGNADV